MELRETLFSRRDSLVENTGVINLDLKAIPVFKEQFKENIHMMFKFRDQLGPSKGSGIC